MSFAPKSDTVCKYYLQGQCRFGTSCRFAHPPGQGPANSGTGAFRNQTWTAKEAKPILFDAESIRKDLTQGVDRPLYPLSSYGPGKCVPCIIDGLDQSPEELRVAAWSAVREGAGLDAYKSHEKQLIDAAQALISSASSTGAITLDEAKRVWNAVDERGVPNSNAQSEAKSRLRERLQPSAPKSVFGTNTTPTSSFGSTTFGSPQPAQTSAFGSSTFVKPGSGAFGSNTGSGTFGGGNTASTFGGSSQPSAFGASQPSAFGTSTQTAGSAFGSSSNASAPAFGQAGFGAKPAFGQSAFGSSTTPTSAFGTSASAPAFGQAGFGGSAPAFGQSGFGAKPATSAFGSSTGGGFGAFAAKASSFGGTGTGNTSAFGASASGPSAFSSSASGTTPTFGTTGGGFGAFANKSSTFSGQTNTGSAFGSSTNNTNNTGNLFVQTAPAATANNNPGEGMDSDTPTTATPPTSIFGQTAPSATTSAFGQSQPASGFGSTSAFGSKSAFGSSAFSTAPATNTTSAFGTPETNATNATNATNTTSAFGSSTTNTTSAFGSTSTFGTAAKSSAFGGTSAFGSGSTTTSAFGSAFGQSKSNPFGPKSAKDRDPYAGLLPEDYISTLSEGIINAFKAEKFELGSIPECVPPLEMR